MKILDSSTLEAFLIPGIFNMKGINNCGSRNQHAVNLPVQAAQELGWSQALVLLSLSKVFFLAEQLESFDGVVV